jgi:predicted lipoprotein with Yx(FWY)xxD motif
VFAAVELGMFIAVLVLARHQWFTHDEWDFIGNRNGGSINDLLRPHNEHWSTLPILVYRGLFNLFGLNSYLPYQTVVLTLHLTAGALLRVIMRRNGVSPWVATAAASLFVLLGAGYQNIIWAFQISFVGSLVFGLGQLLLASHDGPLDRRDWLGLLAGVAGLMCSGVGLTMAVIVGIATLVRRGWRVALFHTGPLALLYGTWWFGYAHRYYHGPGIHGGLGLLARWVETGLQASFEAMGQVPGVSVALAIILVVGLPLAWGRLDREELKRRAAAPAALLIGAIILLVTAGSGRAAVYGVSFVSRNGRYFHLVAALMLPAIAVATDALARRWRVLLPVVLVPFVIGIPGNLEALANPGSLWATKSQIFYRQSMLSLANSPVASDVPRSIRADNVIRVFKPGEQYSVTIGWLLDQKAAGRIPDPNFNPRVKANAILGLALQQSHSSFASTDAASGAPASLAATPPPTSSVAELPASTVPLVRIDNNPKVGPILVDNDGMALYTLTNGYRPLPCTGTCGATWRPLLAPAGTKTVSGGSGVTGLGATGSGKVVTYWGYPLFRYLGDTGPGDTKGSEVKSFGGVWHTLRVGTTKVCTQLTAPVTRRLEKGESIGIKGGTVGVIYFGPHGQSDLRIFNPAAGNTLQALAGPLTVQIEQAGAQPTTLCM